MGDGLWGQRKRGFSGYGPEPLKIKGCLPRVLVYPIAYEEECRQLWPARRACKQPRQGARCPSKYPDPLAWKREGWCHPRTSPHRWGLVSGTRSFCADRSLGCLAWSLQDDELVKHAGSGHFSRRRAAGFPSEAGEALPQGGWYVQPYETHPDTS